MKKKRNDAWDRLLTWLEDGDAALEREMQETLSEEVELNRPAAPGTEEQRAPSDPSRSRQATPAKQGEKQEKKQGKKPDKKREKPFADTWGYRALAALICLGLIGLLLHAALRMPAFGGADTLVDSEVTAYYVENTLKETGAENIVTGIILDYRGFDTLGESHVLFIAVCTVLLLLSVKGEKDEAKRLLEAKEDQRLEPGHDVILQSAARILTPLLLVFGLYIILNGHLSPGGGFSGGAVLGAALILYQNAFGYEKTEKFFTFKTFRWVSVCALLSYSLMKGWHFFTGANGVENGVPLGTAGNILSGGLLLPLNLVVGLVVACTMYALYTMFRKGEF